MLTVRSPAVRQAFRCPSQHGARLLAGPGKTDNRGRVRRMEEFLASILARFAYLVAEAIIVRLIRAFMAGTASPVRS